MPDEQGYVSYLLDFATATSRLQGIERFVLQKAYDLWRSDAEIEAFYDAELEKWQKRQAQKEDQERQRQFPRTPRRAL